MSPETIAELQSLLDQHRQRLARLLHRSALQGGSISAHPRVLRGLVEARADLAEVKSRLRALGADTDDRPDDEELGAVASAREPAGSAEHAALHRRLERQRAYLAALRDQQARVGGPDAAKPETRRALAETRGELAETIARLRALGVDVPNQPDEDQTFARVPRRTAAPTSAAHFALKPRQRAELLSRLARHYQRQLGKHPLRPRPGLHLRPTAVDPSWGGLRQHTPVQVRALPPDTPALDLFDAQGHQLLVLGTPGAGKTTLLAELALALVRVAQADTRARIPLLLDLSTWIDGDVRFWLHTSLPSWQGISRDLALQLASGDQELLLLDGLDGLPAAQRAACIETLNAYLTACDLVPLAVACRTQAYTESGLRLELASTVELAPPGPAASRP